MTTNKFQLYDHDRKNKKLDNMANSCASLWNHVVKLDQKYYKIYKKSPTIGEMQKYVAKITKKSPFWKKLGSQTIQDVVERYYDSKKRFFKKIGKHPKTKKWRNFKSFCFKQNVGYKIVGNHLYINCLGKRFTFYKDREIEGEIKNIRLKRTSSGKWFLCVCTTKSTKNTLEKRCNANPEGFDFGLKTYLTSSSGDEYKSPRFLKKTQKKLAKAQKSLSRKVKGSNHRKQAKLKVAKIHEKIVNQRGDYQWKLAHELCKKHNVICLEDLNMRGMQKLWGNKVGDLCHSEFIVKLEYIATKYGTDVVKVDRFYPSSKLCSSCGYKHIGLRLIDREWDCPECGQHHNRDVNAAQNILREGILSWGSNSKTMLDSSLMGSCVDTRNPHLKVGEYVI